jgi:microcystin degradation protein MlrC
MAAAPLHMVGIFGTTSQPLRSFVDRLAGYEGREGILSVSLAHGFPYADVPDVGAAMLVVADGDVTRAAALAETLGREAWGMREAIAARRLATEAALDVAEAHEGRPVVLADVADNAGGGAPSDSTFLLRRMLERGMTSIASGLYWDPLAVRLCIEAGEGARFDLRVGGKAGPQSGMPLDLRVTVERIVPDARQTFGPATNPLGEVVRVSADGDLDLVLCSVRAQTFHPDAFTQTGLDLAGKRFVVVKSMHHFHAGFAPIASRLVYVAGEGALPSDYAALRFEKRPGPFWPAVADPHGPAGPRATIRSLVRG